MLELGQAAHIRTRIPLPGSGPLRCSISRIGSAVVVSNMSSPYLIDTWERHGCPGVGCFLEWCEKSQRVNGWRDGADQPPELLNPAPAENPLQAAALGAQIIQSL